MRCPMKEFLKKFYLFTEKAKDYIRAAIDRLAAKDIEKAQRNYELNYGKELNESEIIEIKKNVVIRIWKYVIAILIVIIFLTSTLVRG